MRVYEIPVSVSISIYWTTAAIIRVRLSVTTFLPWQTWVVAKEAEWSTKPLKCLLSGPLLKKNLLIPLYIQYSIHVLVLKIQPSKSMVLKIVGTKRKKKKWSFKYNPFQTNVWWFMMNPSNLQLGYFLIKIFISSIVKCWKINSLERGEMVPFRPTAAS